MPSNSAFLADTYNLAATHSARCGKARKLTPASGGEQRRAFEELCTEVVPNAAEAFTRRLQQDYAW